MSVTVKDHHTRDFDAYRRFDKVFEEEDMRLLGEGCLRFDPTGTAVEYMRGEYSPYESFASFEDTGKLLPTNDIPALASALRGKRLLNFQIKQWAQTEGAVGQEELKAEFSYLPEWVWKALTNQRKKNTKGIFEDVRVL